MSVKLFGTDGVRGAANAAPMDSDTMMRLAGAAAAVLLADRDDASVLIGRDTRLSGPMIEAALTAGFLAAGADVVSAGELPTPAVSSLVQTGAANIGVMISASHNPFGDNGVKLFAQNGAKISDAAEAAIAERVLGRIDAPRAAADGVGRLSRMEDAGAQYLTALREAVGPLDLSGLKIVVDAANGAAHEVGPTIFQALGAKVDVIACDPDGVNINAGCGATAPAALGEAVRKAGADVGVALDGDADRLIVCDETGAVLDGDQILGAVGRRWKADGRLKGDAVVATVMSNGGLEAFLAGHGVALRRTPVGDRHVAAAMKAEGCNLGGEQSGHVIMSDYAATGDGLLAALNFLAVMRADGRPVSVAGRVFKPWPQKLVNIRYPVGTDPLNHPGLKAATEAAEAALRPSGRVLIRKSGTEPLIRVMTEGEDAEQVHAQAEALAQAVRDLFADAAA